MSDNQWTTPDALTVRSQNRDYITARIKQPLVPNDVPRVLADANGMLASQMFQYQDFLSKQFLATTASGYYLEQIAQIYLTNADGSLGRKAATYSTGTGSITAQVSGTILPAGTQFTTLNGSAQIVFETFADTAISDTTTTFAIRSLTAGSVSNLDPGSGLTLTDGIPGIVFDSGQIVLLTGGADAENDDQLRARLLSRIRQPAMGGDASDYEQWALSYPGVTRAWCAPGELGLGTVTLRFMMDGLRADRGGVPTQDDVNALAAYIDTVRPVTAQVFVAAPVPAAFNLTISNLSRNTASTKASITTSIQAMVFKRARPAQAVYGKTQPPAMISRAAVSNAISNANGVSDFDLTMDDFVPPNNGCIAVLGDIFYV